MSRSPNESILIVSQHREVREEVAAWLRGVGYGVRVAGKGEDGLETLEREPAALVVADRMLPDLDPHVFLQRLGEEQTGTELIFLCDEPSLEDTVALMREGAFHILGKPVQSEELKVVAAKALEHGRLTRGNQDLKARLELTERLAMIGRLASGVAHELNNPLDGVRRYVRLTLDSLETEEREQGEYLEHALSGLSRMAAIVRQLLTFSRNVVLENEDENLRGLLDEVVRTLSPSGSARPSVQLENPFLDLHVPKALFQVFANLVRNALDAVEDKGPRGRVHISVKKHEQDVEIRVKDNGYGIEGDNLRRVFEPFFTTKEVGKGTGLGLPISARIVERCGGTIRIESEPGVETTVTVALPLSVTAQKVSPLLHGTGTQR
ncbi:MAG: ATP-binding protein [Planctomycetota bacterium]